MKSVSILGALLITTSAVFANVDKPASSTGVAVVKSGAVFKVFYKSAKTTDVKVSIYNAANQVVFTEVLRKVDGFVRPYNFSSLSEGQYTIEIANGEERQIEKVNYASGRIEKLANLMRVAGEQNKYVLTLSNKNQQMITINVLNENGEVVFTENERIEGDFAKVYNLENMKGKFSFEITAQDGTTKTLSL